MPLAQIQEVARGRVWTGADAKEHGLVDELGGFWLAVDDVKRLSGIAPQTRIAFKTYPRPRGFFGAVSRLADGAPETFEVLDRLAAFLDSAPMHLFMDVLQAAPNGTAELKAAGLPH
jgi:protease-4